MRTVYELKKKRKKKHRLLKAALSIVVLAVISLLAAILITNKGHLNIEGLRRLFAGTSVNQKEAAEYSYTANDGSVYAVMDGGLAVCSDSGLQVFNTDAQKTFSVAYNMQNPAICAGKTVSAVYDLGGTDLKVFDLYGVTKTLTTEEKIIAASLNKNNWLAVCTQETGGFKGRVTVYDASGEERYHWDSSGGYVLSAAVSPDNESMAALTLTDEGSRIVFYDLDSIDEKGACTIPGSLVLEIRYLSDGSLLAVKEEALLRVKRDGGADVLNDFGGKYLAGYALDGDGFAAVALNDYLVGDQGHIVTVNQNGKVLGSAEAGKKIVSLSAKGDYLAVLFADGLVIYDRNMKECARFTDTAGAEQVIMRTDGKAVLLTPQMASVRSIPST